MSPALFLTVLSDTVTNDPVGYLLSFVVLLAGVAFLLWRATRSSSSDVVDPDEPVVVGGPGAEIQIEILRSKLEAMGIDAYTRNRTGRVMPGGVPPAFAGWEVLVRGRDADEARAILADVTIESE